MMMTFEVNDIDYGWSEGGETKQQRFGLISCDTHHPSYDCDDVDVGFDDHDDDPNLPEVPKLTEIGLVYSHPQDYMKRHVCLYTLLLERPNTGLGGM